jgi:hypothetical protein
MEWLTWFSIWLSLDTGELASKIVLRRGGHRDVEYVWKPTASWNSCQSTKFEECYYLCLSRAPRSMLLIRLCNYLSCNINTNSQLSSPNYKRSLFPMNSRKIDRSYLLGTDSCHVTCGGKELMNDNFVVTASTLNSIIKNCTYLLQNIFFKLLTYIWHYE